MRMRRHVLLAVAAAILSSTLLLGLVLAPSTEHSDSAGAFQNDPALAVNGDASFQDTFSLGAHMLAVGRHEGAITAFERARVLRPRQPEVYVNLGYANFLAGDYNAAEQSFRTALDLRPSQVNAYFGWAESLEALGDIEAAVGAMRAFIHLAANDDPFLRRARSAVWEWSEFLARQQAGQAEEKHDTVAKPTLQQIEENRQLLSETAGKVKVVNIWATWCPPCRAELPSLQELSNRLDPDEFAVIGLSVDDDPDFVREFLKDAGVTYPNYMDSGKKIAGDQLGVDSYPQTLILRPDGVLVDRIIGARDWSSAEFVSRIQQVARGPID